MSGPGSPEPVERHPVADAGPLSLPVVCGSTTHRLRWVDGVVEAVDHSDLEAELALIGFGGAEPACLAMTRLWRDAVNDGGFLGEWADDRRLGDSWFSWLAMALERMRAEGFHEFLRGLPPGRALRMGEFLHHFPVSWIDRAAATVAAGLDRSVEPPHGPICPDAPGMVEAGTASRFRTSLVRAVGGRQVAVGAAALVPLRIEVGAGVAEPVVRGALTGPDRGLEVTLDRSWLHRVWAVGADVVDGRLVLDRSGSVGPGDRGTALVVSWPDGRRPRLDRVRLYRPRRDRDDRDGPGRWVLHPTRMA